MAWTDVVQAVSSAIQGIFSIGTVIAVFYAARQLKMTDEQARTQFEDDLTKQYRDIIYQLPIEALFAKELEATEINANLSLFHRYFDLTNQQIFLRQKHRVSNDTWEEWRTGIESRMARSPFKEAWVEVKTKTGNEFDELRKLEDYKFKGDPLYWPQTVLDAAKAEKVLPAGEAESLP